MVSARCHREPPQQPAAMSRYGNKGIEKPAAHKKGVDVSQFVLLPSSSQSESICYGRTMRTPSPQTKGFHIIDIEEIWQKGLLTPYFLLFHQ